MARPSCNFQFFLPKVIKFDKRARNDNTINTFFSLLDIMATFCRLFNMTTIRCKSLLYIVVLFSILLYGLYIMSSTNTISFTKERVPFVPGVRIHSNKKITLNKNGNTLIQSSKIPKIIHQTWKTTQVILLAEILFYLILSLCKLIYFVNKISINSWKYKRKSLLWWVVLFKSIGINIYD